MKKRVAVVGAGIAGLGAAYSLGVRGFEAEVFEREERPGGRMLTDRSVEGFAVDAGAQFFYDVYENTFRLCRELGIAGRLEKFESPYGVFRDGKIHRLDPPAKNPLSLFAFGGLSPRAKAKLFRLIPVLAVNYRRLSLNHPERWERLDRADCAAYSLRHLSRELLEYLVQPLISGLCLGEPERVSAVVMLSGLKFQMLSRLYALRGGIDVLPRTLAERCRVHYGTPVTRIVLGGGAARGVAVGGDGGARTLEYDAVVCAVPGDAAPGLIPDAPPQILSFLKSVEYSTGIIAAFGLGEKLFKETYAVAVPRASGMSVTALSENTNKSPSSAPAGKGVALAFLSGRASGEMLDSHDDAVAAAALREIAAIIPGAPEPVFSRVYRWKPGLVLFNPGYVSEMNRFRREERNVRGLFFAGDYMMTASVEGSLTSGLQAAERAEKFLTGT
ncbi:MAG: NAD(P)/FAD-dependent oxidoreductase [bacterium]